MSRPIFKVWIEIEEYDEDTGTGVNVDLLSIPSTADFNDVEKARVFVERLHRIGEILAEEEGK